MRDSPTRPRARKVLATSRDSHIDLFDTRGTADDPTLAGGSLRVRTTAGDTFDMQFVLPATGSYAAPIATQLPTQPLIDWNPVVRASDNATLRIFAEEPQRKWSQDFVGSLGKSVDELNPNQKIKVRLPASVSVTKPLGSLKP